MRKRGYIASLFIALIMCLTACDTTSSDDDVPLVIRALVYEGTPITEIQITRPADFLSTTAQETAITDAEVTLFKEGQSHSLTPTPNRPGYYHLAATDLPLSVDDSLRLEVRTGDLNAQAAAIIPRPPRILFVSDTLLTVPDDEDDLADVLENDEPVIQIDWEHNDEGPYAPLWITQTYLEDTPRLIDPFAEDAPPPDSAYYTEENVAFDAASIAYFGRMQVCLHSVTDTYWDFINFRQDTIRRIYEPQSNVEDGLGIFAGFSTSCYVFHIIDERDTG